MTAIDDKYEAVYEANPWIGEPVQQVDQVCGADKKGSFRDYQGGASIYLSATTGAHLIHGLIRAKWMALGGEKGPHGYPTTDEADAGSGKGRFNDFQKGTIIWKSDTPEAFSVHGKIYGRWGKLHADMGPLGFPLTDERPADSGTGRYNDFEHGAIYYHPTLGTQVVRSPILEAWTVAFRDSGPLGFPISDTPETADTEEAYTQKFQGGSISCTKGASRSIVTSAIVTPRIEPLYRSLVLAANPQFAEAWRVKDSQGKVIDDTRVCEVMQLNKHLQLKTALVIFRESYTRSLTDAETTQLKLSYLQAIARINAFSFGIGRIKPKWVVVEPKDSILEKTDFRDLGNDADPGIFQAEFNAYPKVIAALQAKNLSPANFDIVSINVPWADTTTDKSSGFAWANPTFKLQNSRTWSTVHYVRPPDPPYWWAFYVHETTHCIEWMLEQKGYPELRNNDDHWWAVAYPHLISAAGIDPAPENLEDPADPTDRRLYAMHQRIKSSWFNLAQGDAPKWGKTITDATTPENFGNILVYSCPDSHVVVETAWSTKYLMT